MMAIHLTSAKIQIRKTVTRMTCADARVAKTSSFQPYAKLRWIQVAVGTC